MKRTITLAAGAAALLLTSTGAFAQMNDAAIKSAVEAKGYTKVKITDHDKTHVDFRATKNGKTVKLAVDPKTGAITADKDKDRD